MMYLHYKVIKLIGEGGMGKVYLAEDTHLEKIVALKVLNSELCRETQFIERFKREAKIQSKLSHQNIVTLHNLLRSDDTYFIVMEFAEGITLQELIRNTGLIPEIRALKIFDQILNVLKYAHSKKVIHRDIKPSNIMISENDDVKIMDFGIAKLLGDRTITKTNTKLGSLYYMSPEQINNPNDVDYRTDLYSLGIVLFEMVTGKLPYDVDTDSDFKIMNEIVYAQTPNPQKYYPYISDKTVELILSFTNKNRDFRKKEYSAETDKTVSEINPTVKNEDTRIVSNNEKKTNEHKKIKIDKLIKSKWRKISLLFLSIFILTILILFITKGNDTSHIDKKTTQSENISENDNNIKYISQVTDIDGNVYNTVKIGSQEWLVENLNVSHYSNGDEIPHVQFSDEWLKLTSGAWCFYENNSNNGKIYGKLYNWYSVNDKRGLAPKGWHIPTDEEWQKLTYYLGGDKVAGGDLKATTLWKSQNIGATNKTGFTAFPGGTRLSYGLFDFIGMYGLFWTATENYYGNAWMRFLFHLNSDMSRYFNDKRNGLSVRCVKD